MRSSKECTSGPKRFEEEKKRLGRLDGKRIQGLRGAIAGITHELPCPRVHRSLLTKTIKLNDASSDASPGQKLFFFSSGASRNCCVVIMMTNQKVFRTPRRRSDPSWVTSVGHFSGHSRGSLLWFFSKRYLVYLSWVGIIRVEI